MTAFTEADFFAYDSKKWMSKAYTLERRVVKGKLEKIAKLATSKERENFLGFHYEISDEFPSLQNNKKVDSQWLWFSRDTEEQKRLTAMLEKIILEKNSIFNLAPYHHHAILFIHLNFHRIEVGVRIHTDAWIDLDNLSKKIALDWEKERFVKLLKILPEKSEAGIENDFSLMIDDTLSSVSITELTQKLHSLKNSWFFCRKTFLKSEVVGEENFEEVLSDVLVKFLPLFRFICWSRDNDHIQMKETLKQEKKETRPKTIESFSIGEEVSIHSGLFSGKSGTIREIDNKGNIKIQVGIMAINLKHQDITKSR